MPVGEIVGMVTGIVGCVAGVCTAPCVVKPLVEFYGYLKEEPQENLSKLENKKDILKKLMDFERNSSAFLEIGWREAAELELENIDQCMDPGSSFSFLANYRLRYRVGKNTQKIEKQVTELRNKLAKGLRIAKFPFEEGEVGESEPIRSFLVGREGVIQEIMTEYRKSLSQLAVTKIFGVYGAIGVGKTEVVEHICSRILQSDMGHLVTLIWVDAASCEDELQKLQMKIANKFKLELPTDNSVRNNAKELKKKLQNEYILLVLDNVRKAFSLEEIGFPHFTGSRKTIVITSQSLSVCSQMNCDWKIGLKSLSVDEAYELLVEEVGFQRTSSTEEIHSSLEKIAKECGGLPLAIVAVGRYLRKFHGYDPTTINRFLKIESAAFSNLKYVEDKVFQDLMLRYEQLKDGSYSFAEECLLYLTMYPRNYAFASTALMTCWIGEGLLSKVEGKDEKWGKARETMEELKDASLLESIASESGIETVKMHPLVWDMTVKFKKENHRFLAKRECRLEKIAYEDWFEDVERVSLVKNNLKELPRSPINYHKLSTLILQGNPLDTELGCDFFNSFPNLKILDLSDTHVRLRPESVSCLKHLNVLLLQNCIHLSRLPSLSGLVALMILDISGCSIDELPSLSEFVALMILNISGCPITKLPSLVGLGTLMVLDVSRCPITKLPSLSELMALLILDVSYCPLEELPDGMNHLTGLVRLNLSGTRIKIFPSCLIAKHLNNLQELLMIRCDVSWQPRMQGGSATSKEDVLKLKYLNVLEITFHSLQAYDVYVRSSSCGRLRSFKFCVGGLYEGKLRKNSVAFINRFPTDQLFLPKNTSELLLKNCYNEIPLIITDGNSLANLKFLDISCCKNLKSLFKHEDWLDLNTLEELTVTHCPILEKVMESKWMMMFLPMLRKLTLCELPEFRSTDFFGCWHIQAIGIWKCSKLEQLFPIRLVTDEEPNFKIRGDKSWLDNLRLKNANNPNVIFLENNFIEEPPPEELTSRDTGMMDATSQG